MDFLPCVGIQKIVLQLHSGYCLVLFRLKVMSESGYCVFSHFFASLHFSSCDILWNWIKCRDVELTEKLDYSSAVALLGFSLIVAILRVFNVRDEAARVMVAAPLIAFVTTHILYLNFYQLDYGKPTASASWTIIFCFILGCLLPTNGLPVDYITHIVVIPTR